MYCDGCTSGRVVLSELLPGVTSATAAATTTANTTTTTTTTTNNNNYDCFACFSSRDVYPGGCAVIVSSAAGREGALPILPSAGISLLLGWAA